MKINHIAAVAVYAAAAILIFAYRNEIVAWMQEGTAPIALLFPIAVGLIVFPVIPYKIMIGLLGYLYGALWGALISWLAAAVGSVILFVFVQAFFRKQGRAALAKFSRLEKLQQSFERYPFRTVLIARMIPVLPQTAVNVYASMLSIRLSTFAIASALGKIPAMLVYAYIGQHLFSDPVKLLMAVGVYASFLAVAYAIYRRMSRPNG